MKELKGKYIYFSLFTIFLLNIVMRYPSSVHSTGTDSFQNLAVSSYIVVNGHLDTFANPLSFFGLYPFSRNMGGAYLLSGLSLVIGINVEQSLFILCIFLIGIAILGTFFLCRSFFPHRNNLALIAALLFVTSRKTFYFTDWTYSYRGPFLCLLPLFFNLLLLNVNSRRFTSVFSIPHLSVLVIYMLSLMSMHRIAYFFIFFIPTSFLVQFTFLYARLWIKKNDLRLGKNYVLGFILFSIISLLLGILDRISFYKIKFGDIAPDFVNEKIEFLGLLSYPLLFSFAYSKITSILFPFFVIGIVRIYSEPLRNEARVVLVITSFLFVLFWYDISYASMFFLPFLIIGNGYGITIFYDYVRKNVTKKSTFPVLVSILIFSQFIAPSLVSLPSTGSSSEGSTESVEEAKALQVTYSYDTGLYLKVNSNLTIITTYVTSSSKVEAFCNCPSLDLNVPDYYLDNVDIEVIGKIIDATTRSLYQLDYVPSRDYKYSFLLNNKTWGDGAQESVIQYEFGGNKKYNYLSTSGMESYMSHDGVIKEVQFSMDLDTKRYRFYDNGMYSVTHFSY